MPVSLSSIGHYLIKAATSVVNLIFGPWPGSARRAAGRHPLPRARTSGNLGDQDVLGDLRSPSQERAIRALPRSCERLEADPAGIDGFVATSASKARVGRVDPVAFHMAGRKVRCEMAHRRSTTRLNSAAATTSFRNYHLRVAKSCRIRRLPMAYWLNSVWTRRRSAPGSLRRSPRFCRPSTRQDRWLRRAL